MNVDGTETGKKVAASRRSGQRNAVTLMVGTLASRVTGLLRTSLLLQLFDANITDAFNVAWKVPNLFRELLAEGALTNSFIPIYKSLPREEGRKLSGALFALLALVNALLVAGAILAAPWVVDLLLAERSTVNYQLAVQLTRIIFPVLAAISLSALAMGILNAEERFFAPAWAPVALNIVVIIMMLLFPGQAQLLALSVVLGGVAQLLIQLPALLQARLLPRFGRWWHPSLAAVLLLMAPFAFTTGARQFLNIVATALLSAMPEGSITAYENANLIFSLALGLFSVSPALAFYSRLSGDANDVPESFKHTLLTGLRFISFLTVPAGLLVFFLAEPAVRTIWDLRPAPGQEQTIFFSVQAVAPLGFAVFPWGINNLLIRPFYVRKKIRAPIIISIIFISLNGFLYVYLAPLYGIVGMSVATVVVGWLQLAVLLLWMRRDEGLELSSFLYHALRVWLAALLAGGLAYLSLRFLTFVPDWLGSLLQVITGGGIALLAYLLLSALLGLPELKQLSRRLRR